ncbi:hypothetical protein [Amycolatopsis sp. lyj-90]|uniref:hypothetical protein n=1 Tax=Amycolatopsis sp. lyj-90 TaxID=2789285 RepID=UPI00397DC288
MITRHVQEEILEVYSLASRDLWSIVADLEGLMTSVELANPNLRLSNNRMIDGLRWARGEISKICGCLEDVEIVTM